jgi:hypothetical protein
VVHGQPRLMLVAACGSQDVPHARATCLHVVMVSHGRGCLKVLLVPLFAAIDALPAAVDSDIAWCSLTAALGHLPASLGQTDHDCLLAGGMLGGDAVRCLKCVLAKVAMLALERDPCAALGLRADAPLVSLAVGLWLDAPTLPPRRGLG